MKAFKIVFFVIFIVSLVAVILGESHQIAIASMSFVAFLVTKNYKE